MFNEMNIPFCTYIHQKFFEYICKSYALIREIFQFIFLKFTLLKFANVSRLNATERKKPFEVLAYRLHAQKN